MLDNVEKIESECRSPDCRAWYAGLEAQAQERDHHEAQVNAALRAIRSLSVPLTNADLCQLMSSLACRLNHMPEAQQHLDECIGLVECFE